MLAYRNTPHSTTGETPANPLMGGRLRTRIDLIKPSAEGNFMHKQFTRRMQRKATRDGLCMNNCVLVRNYRGFSKWARGTVFQKTCLVFYQVWVTTLRGPFTWRRHLNQLLRQKTEKPVLLQPPLIRHHASAPLPETTTSKSCYPSRQRRIPKRYEVRS